MNNKNYNDKNSGTNDAINTIYKEREDFVIIGLTGRTGSGCTTAAEFLCNDRVSLNVCNKEKLEYNELLKYNIISKYCDIHWHSFKSIKMTDIILTFLFDLNVVDIKKIINNIFNSLYIELKNKKEFINKVIKYKKEYDIVLHKHCKGANSFKDYIDNKKMILT